MTNEELKKMESLKNEIIELKRKLEIEKQKSARDWSVVRLTTTSFATIVWFIRYCKNPTNSILIALILLGLADCLHLKELYDSQKKLNGLRQENEEEKIYKKKF